MSPRLDIASGKLELDHDGRLLFTTRSIRLFAYGFLSVILMIFLAGAGLSKPQIGLLFTLTLLGDTIISLWITTSADRVGRRRMLVTGSFLMVFAGGLFAATSNFALLLIAATIGVISPSGYEVGPFLPIEIAALSHIIPGENRTRVFSWYNLIGSFSTALGALFGGVTAQALQGLGMGPVKSYRALIILYAAIGLALGYLFTRLSDAVEVMHPPGASPSSPGPGWFFGLHRSKGIVLRLSALFSLDAFAGGFVLQSIMAYWFHARFNVRPAALGAIFMGANVLAGLSALSASWIASRIGLIRTMVFTHIPSNLLLILIPLMPNLPLAIVVLLLRFSISQMDVPARQSYTMAVISPDERSAAAGVTGIARTTGASLSPALSAPMLATPALLNMPFFLSGGLKIVYDLLLYRSFRHLKPPEEHGRN